MERDGELIQTQHFCHHRDTTPGIEKAETHATCHRHVTKLKKVSTLHGCYTLLNVLEKMGWAWSLDKWMFLAPNSLFGDSIGITI